MISQSAGFSKAARQKPVESVIQRIRHRSDFQIGEPTLDQVVINGVIIPIPFDGELNVPGHIGRRDFVARVVTTAASAAVIWEAGSPSIAATQPVSKAIDLKSATAATFKGVVGQVFEGTGGMKFTLESVQVISDKNKSKRPKGVRKDSFSLHFSTSAGVHLEPGIYPLTHKTAGKMSVYMNEVLMTTVFSSAGALGQAEMLAGRVAADLEIKMPKSYYEVPFN